MDRRLSAPAPDRSGSIGPSLLKALAATALNGISRALARGGPVGDKLSNDGRLWWGGRVVEGARLERVYTGNRIEGSNPSPTATKFPNFSPTCALLRKPL